MVQDPNNSTKDITSNSDTNDTDSAYSTESESNYTLQPEDTNFSPLQDHIAHLPRPSRIPVLKTLNITKNQQNKDNTSGDEITSDVEHTATTPPTRTCPIPPPRPSKATNVKDTSANQQKQPTQVHPDPTPVRKSPLLPTPPAPVRQFNENANLSKTTIAQQPKLSQTIHSKTITIHYKTITDLQQISPGNGYHYCHY